MNKAIVSATLVFLAALASSAHAQGRGGGGAAQLTEGQRAAVRSINETAMPLTQAVNEARNALNAAVFTNAPDAADIKAKNEKLAAAELARATAVSEAYARLQASPDKLNLPPQQVTMLLGVAPAGRGGRGGGAGGGGRGGDRVPGLEAQEQPPAGARGGGRGGLPQLTEAQQAAVRSITESAAPLDEAATEARNALNASMLADAPNPAEIRARNEKLAAAELARATKLSEAFAKLQSSPNKLDLPQQQVMMLMGVAPAGRGGRGGFGGGRGGAGGPGRGQ